MAITVNVNYPGVLSLAEYVEFVEQNVDLRDIDSLVATAWTLQGLSNNKTFLSEAINQEIKRYLAGDGIMRMYTPQSLILASRAEFLVRANMWIEPSQDPKARELEVPLYSYQSAHDHNFDFVTVGYLGPGYETAIYEYDRNQITGIPGEKVELKFLERTTLPKGKLMVYRCSRDIHEQYPPPKFSVSLNLLVQIPESRLVPQYFFDLNAGTIVRFSEDPTSRRVSLLDFAACIGDENTADILTFLASRHPCTRTRDAATRALDAIGSRKQPNLVNSPQMLATGP
jgi:hypothetical protein